MRLDAQNLTRLGLIAALCLTGPAIHPTLARQGMAAMTVAPPHDILPPMLPRLPDRDGRELDRIIRANPRSNLVTFPRF